MSEVVCIKSQEEYEDDFEKDLDWLISEEGRSEAQVHQCNFCMLSGQTECISCFYFLVDSACFIGYNVGWLAASLTAAVHDLARKAY